MNTELYIENYQADLTKDISALLNFAIDDIKDFSSRSTTWSRTIVLPGTANNNKLFGHIFQVGQSNYYNEALPNILSNFNAAKSAPCIIFQDQIQTFKGVLRLLQININNGFQGACEYEVSVFGSLTGLNVALSGAKLENLDFGVYNHVYNDANIVASWDNPGGSGYYYPLIDYGTYSVNKHDWDIKTFRPALYAREYVDKMITEAGYRWVAPLFDTPRFKSLIVPHTKKIMTINLSDLFNASSENENYGHPPPVVIFGPPELGTLVRFANNTGTGFTSNVDGTIFTYNGTITTNVIITFSFEGTFTGAGSPSYGGIGISLYKNTPDPFSPSWATVIDASPFSVGQTASVNISVAPGDIIQWRVVNTINNSASDVIFANAEFTIKSASGTVGVEISIGDTVNLNDNIPQNIRQVDFLVSVVKLFNLYVYEDKFDEKLIYITPYIDFYSKNFSNAVDWTHKLNRNKVVKVKPMSELNAKIYKFKFKGDGDFYNDLYRKRYNEGYGDRIYDSEFEFAQQTSEFELVFSSTPLVGYGGEDKVYSTIFKQTGNPPTITEEKIDSNIRILQSKKITGVTIWSIKNGSEVGSPVLNTLTKYGYAGHLDDPDIPANDINFGAPKELFFVLTAGSLSNNQFNIYWSNYMREITDKDSKLVTAWFKLDTKDILNLDFSKYIYVDGIAYRLNAINDFDLSSPNDCVVELFKVNSASYSEAPSNEGPPEGCYLLWSDENTLDYDDGEELLYGDCNTNPGDGGGPPPDTYYVNWSTSIAKFTAGSFKIFVNGTLMVNVTGSLGSNTTQSGSFVANTGDEIMVRVQGFSGKDKRVFVSNAIDGVLNDTTTTTASNEYTFTVAANKNYTTQGSII
jgi:hypothetical protein